MNGTLLIALASLAVPVIGLEFARKVRDWRAQPSHSPVWIGVDLASGDGLSVVHDGNGYVADTSHAPGNFEDFPPSDGTSAGAGE
ncbi:hypothetical protein [Sphingomonas hankookensis]|uniref:hypothetical protein n=1 Tax=Sphingomonas hankookensis TaxID=563996 RepID=UPI00234EB225|nr:hypothetical protein [Sphingomonas hankookensis]WCP71571.1 hypothetical protein PPZ50_14600 [Sphingomonas hankookensis]